MIINIFKRIIALALILSLVLPVFAQGSGKLNVFTDLKDAEIYVDGKLAGKEAVVGYLLPVGSHYVKVNYQGKTVYAKTVIVDENRTKTITSDHFVDIRTNTPSRGAVDVEAARLREYRGNAGFGYFGSSPMSGLSVKWWFSETYGLQALGFAETTGDVKTDSSGGRFLIGFPKKIFSEEVLDAYMAIGYSKTFHNDKVDDLKDYRSETTSLAFGVEAKIGSLANALFLTQEYVANDMEDVVIFFGQVLTLGLLNIGYTSLEIGIEQMTLYEGNSYDQISNMKVNFGLHFYF